MLAGLYRTRTPPSEIAELISGIGWVSQLIAIAGGTDRASQGAAKDRVATIDEVIAREPDLIIGSWCGKKFRPERVMARPGFDRTRPRSIET